MKAVIPVVPRDTLEWRKRTGTDRWDEVWDGVLHLPPLPNREHQELEGALERYLYEHWARPRKAKVYHGINVAPVGGWPDKNYRVPDLVLLTPERFSIDRNEYFEGPPDVVVEIHSPGDEAYEKLPFYAELGVPEVWIIDRQSKEPEVYLLRRGRYRKQTPGPQRWVQSPATDLELRATGSCKLAIRKKGEQPSLLPED